MTSNIHHLLHLTPNAPVISTYIDSLALATDSVTAKIPEIKSYPDVVYFNYYQMGISLLFVPKKAYKLKTGLKLNELQMDNLILDSIDLYNVPKSANEGQDKAHTKSSRAELAFTTFPLSPFVFSIIAEVKDKDGKPINRPEQIDITSKTSGKDFVEALGEPDRKGGGAGPSSGSINIWCEWKNDGLMVEFGGNEATGPNAWDAGKDAVWKVMTLFKAGDSRE